MKRNTLIILCVILLLALGLHYWSDVRQETVQTADELENRVVKLTDGESITLVELSGTEYNPAVKIERQGEDWLLTAPQEVKADRHVVRRLIGGLVDGRALERFKPSGDLKQFGLDPAKAVITIQDDKGQSATLLVGEQNPSQNGLYAAVSQQEEILILPNHLQSALFRTLFELRDKYILYLQVAEIEKVEIKRPSGTMVLDRRGDRNYPDWFIDDQVKADRRSIEEMLFALIGLQTGDFYDDVTDLSAYGLDEPVETMVLTMEDGSPQGIIIGGLNEEKGQRYVRRITGGPVMTVNETALNILNPDQHALMERRLWAGLDSDQVDLIRLKKGEQEVVYALHDGQWRQTKPTDRAVSIQDSPAQLIWDITELKWEETPLKPGKWSLQKPQLEIELELNKPATEDQPAAREIHRLLVGEPDENMTLLPIKVDDENVVRGISRGILYMIPSNMFAEEQ